jgi:hypothetical protein
VSRHMLYLIGEPGAGKTTLVRRLTRNVACTVGKAPHVTWTQYSPKVIQLGHDRGVFGGTDALGMAAQKHVIAWLNDGGRAHQYVLAEGDRLANAKFFEAVKELGFKLTVACVTVPEDVLAARREERNARIGKAQDERWLKTRATKVANLVAAGWVEPAWELLGTAPRAELVKVLAQHPVGQAIRKLRAK